MIKCFRVWTALIAASLTTTALSAEFPSQPIRLVVPYAAGGSTDLISRTAGRLLEKALKVPVVIENKPGANTIVAARHVAMSTPNGYTLMVAGTASTNVNHFLYKQLPYDIERDFVPVGMLSRMPYAVLVNPKSGVSTATELAELARKTGKGLNYGTAGNGNPMHLAALMFEAQSHVKMVQVPYQGSAPALNALIADEVQVTFDVLGTALPFVKAGRIKLLAVTTESRVEQTPTTPTMVESGFKDYVVETGFAVLAPSGTPQDVVERLNRAFNAMLSAPEYKEAVRQQTLVEYLPMSVEEMKGELRREREKWGNIIQTNGIKLD